MILNREDIDATRVRIEALRRDAAVTPKVEPANQQTAQQDTNDAGNAFGGRRSRRG